MAVRTMNAESVARSLGGAVRAGPQWKAKCPVHADEVASLVLRDGPDGLLWKCHAGCSQTDVMSALRSRDLLPERERDVFDAPVERAPARRIVATYDYRDATGELRYQTVRYVPKDFRQRRPVAGGDWVWSLAGVELVPYRLPEMLADPDARVWIVEGEKDADNLTALGLVATCNPMGAGKWPSTFAQWFMGRDVAVVGDNDKAGREHVGKVATALAGVAGAVRMVALDGLVDKGDVSDWLEAGGTRERLEALADAAPRADEAVVAASDDLVAHDLLPLSDAGNAERLVRAHGANIRWVAEWKTWLVWSGTHWAKDVDGAVLRLMLATVRAIPLEAIGDSADAVVKFAIRSEALTRLQAGIELARALPGITISASVVDADQDLLVFANGVMDTRTGVLREHRRDEMITRLIRHRGVAAIYDPMAECPSWHAFLGRVQPDGEVQAYLQRLAGYGATGHVRERMLAIFWGGGRNGKSTFVETMKAALGEHAMQSSTDLIMQKSKPGETGAATPELANLHGKRFVVLDETNDGGRLDESRVKWITGGDKLTARRLFGDPFEFDPTHTIVLTTNHRPVVRGGGEAIWDRIQQVPWDVRIPDEEQDQTLKPRLLDELPGIMAWIVLGAVRWQMMGLKPPSIVRDATRAYRDDNDWFGQFLEETCDIAPGLSVASSDIHQAYVRWAELAAEKPLSAIAFGRVLTEAGKARGFEQRRTMSGRTWHGIGLR